MKLNILKTYWKESLAYRAEYLISVFVVPMRFFILVFIWSAVYGANQANVIQGYTLSNLITYFMISTFVFIAIFNDVEKTLEKEIKKGDFMIYLLKPVNFPVLEFMKMIARRLFAILIEILPILTIFILFFKEYLVMGKIGFFLISVGIAFVSSYVIYLLIGMMAFWLINIRSLAWILDFAIQFASGLFFPLNLLPSTIEKILSFLPFKYLIFVPVNMYLGKYSTGLESGFTNTVYFQLLIQLLWCFILILFAYFVWKKAIRRFSGVGA